jgi:hypothetical protein
MSDDGDNSSSYQPALAAAEEYIKQTGTGAGEGDVDVAVLPVLSSIWDCYWQPGKSMRIYLIVCGCITEIQTDIMSSGKN